MVWALQLTWVVVGRQVVASALEGTSRGCAGALPNRLRSVPGAVLLVGAGLVGRGSVPRAAMLRAVPAVPCGCHVRAVRGHVPLGKVHVRGVVVVAVVLVGCYWWHIAWGSIWHLHITQLGSLNQSLNQFEGHQGSIFYLPSAYMTKHALRGIPAEARPVHAQA